MQILRNKTKTATIVMVIMLVMTALIVIVPTINAVDIDEEIDTYAYISVVPNPIGVSQEVTVTMLLIRCHHVTYLVEMTLLGI